MELRAGDSVTLISTPGKGYGPKGRRPKVPGDVHLVFLLTVVSITQGDAVSKSKNATKSPAPPSKVQSKVDEAMRKLRARRDRIVLENVSKPSSNKEESKPKPKLVPKSKPAVETRRDARPVVTKQKPRLTTPEKSRHTAEEKEEATPVPPVRRYRKKSADPPASILSIPPSLPPSRKDDVVAPPSLPPSRKKDDDVKAPPRYLHKGPDVSKKKKKKKRKVSPPRSSNTTEEEDPLT